jgi:transcriptional regulator of acetoin/glycerol metabolism
MRSESLDTTIVDDTSLGEEGPRRVRTGLLWVHPEPRWCELALGRARWRLGRSPDCEIPVHDDGASREHAEIQRKGPVLVLNDLGSTNGTFVNGARVEQVPLKAGSVLRIGECIGVLCATVEDDIGARFSEISPTFYAGPSLRRVLEPLARVASSDLPILIEGDTGTGKERVAQYIHEQSGRAGPFHAVNCAALPPAVAENELFGHVRGAFTGADSTHSGHFLAAHRGTLFLDEIAELSLPIQAKLLRVVQDQKVTRLGDTRSVPVDVRIVTACQGSLGKLVEAQRFRADLRARLAGARFELPSLRGRPEEVVFYFKRFLDLHSGRRSPAIDGRVIERLCLQDWPGNLRELELLARELLILHGHEPMIRRAHLPEHLRANGSAADTPEPAQKLELRRLAAALHAWGGNLTHASAALGMSRARAYRLLEGRRVDHVMAQFPAPQRFGVSGRES